MDIHFDWRVALHRDDREALRNNVVESLHNWVETGSVPATVIVSPVRFDPYDERVAIEIRSDSGEVLSSGQHIEPKESRLREAGIALSDRDSVRFASPALQLSMI